MQTQFSSLVNFNRITFVLTTIQLNYCQEKSIKMEDLINLNTSNKSGEKIKKFDDLTQGTYLVKSFKLKDTTFGLRLYVQIDDFYLVLPPRYTDKINSDEQLQELNGGKFKMIYHGKNKDEYNKLMIDFKPLKEVPNITTDSGSDEDDLPLGKPLAKKQKSLKRARN